MLVYAPINPITNNHLIYAYTCVLITLMYRRIVVIQWRLKALWGQILVESYKEHSYTKDKSTGIAVLFYSNWLSSTIFFYKQSQ